MTTTGKVWLVGAGPGDAKLLTLRGAEALAAANVVIFDYLVNPRLLDLAPHSAERIYVGKKAGAHTLSQEEIQDLLIRHCKEGKQVVRLKGGDPFVFGRGGEEALALREAGCPFEVVPGITAGIAAAAYAGIPVTHRGIAAGVTFVTGHEDPTKSETQIDWHSLAHSGHTLVFYMGVSNLESLAERLIAEGLPRETPVALVRWGTYPNQQTLTGTLNDIAELARRESFAPPAIIVVGKVVCLRDSLEWFERRPLFGKRIVVTRSRAQSSPLTDRLESLGAEVVECSVIRIAPPEDLDPLVRAVRHADAYDWIVFTSVNGVDAFFNALYIEEGDARSLGGVRVCAIGPATAHRLKTHGIVPDWIPEKFSSEDIVLQFREHDEPKNKRILLPQGDLARPKLSESLKAMGAEVDSVVAYRTLPEIPENIDSVRQDLKEGRISAITFLSPSAAINFGRALGDSGLCLLHPDTHIVSIGPETTLALQSGPGIVVHEAVRHTADGVADKVVQLLSES
jgi:uroporphyrinogen III methyltransferase/synthase